MVSFFSRKLAVILLGSAFIVVGFNNCSDNFKVFSEETMIAHEASTSYKAAFVNAATDNTYYNGKDLTFNAAVEGIDSNMQYQWQYTLNGNPQGCNMVAVANPNQYKLNCPTGTGELVIGLVVKSSFGDITADNVKYILTQDPGANGGMADVNFSIPAGTGSNPWNTAANPIKAKIGQKIIIKNDDTVVHRMHTNGSPCPHGANINPGQSAVCVVNSVFNSFAYDHNLGTASKVYITTTAQ